MADFTVTPTEPRATVDFAQIAISGADVGHDPDGSRTPPFRYRIHATGPSDQVLKSHEFSVSPDGDHVWDNLAFDEAGAWTLDLVDVDDEDNVIDTDSLTVA